MKLIFEKRYKEIKKFINQKKYKKFFIITGFNSYYKSGASKYFEKIFRNKKVKIYFKKNNIPEVRELYKIIKDLNKFKPDLIIAIGGGSVLDYAKLSNVLFNEKNPKIKIKRSIYNFKKKKAKLLAIPTTAGSGAEVTPFAAIYIGDQKYSVEHKFVKPDYQFLVPELVISGNKKVKASAGFDAISQALESMLSIKSNTQSLNYSLNSLKLSIKNYEKFIKRPNKNNVLNMCVAANLAGKAITTAKTNGPHAVSYPFSVHYNISHGHAVSLTTSQFLNLYYLKSNESLANFSIKKRFKKIFNVLKVKNINEFNQLLKKLKKAGSLEGDYKKLGINLDSNYHKILDGVNAQRLSNCPIKIDVRDIKKIIKMKL